MPYAPIPLDSSAVPDSIRYFVGNRVEPYLRDVRLMLTAPPTHDAPALTENGLDAVKFANRWHLHCTIESALRMPGKNQPLASIIFG